MTLQMVDPPQVRIAVIDGVDSSLAGLTQLLSDQPGWRVVYSARSAYYVVDVIRRGLPEVAIISESAQGSGLRLVRRILQAAASTAVLVRLDRPGPEATEEYLRAGARGCMEVAVADAELVRAVRRAVAGGFGLSPAVLDELIPHLLAASAPDATPPDEGGATPNLSYRERQVYFLLGKGRSLKEIARALNVSHKTVSFHLQRLRQKLGLRTTAQLARHATERFLLDDVSRRDAASREDVDPDAKADP